MKREQLRFQKKINNLVDWLHTLDFNDLQVVYSVVTETHRLKHADPDGRAFIREMLAKFDRTEAPPA